MSTDDHVLVFRRRKILLVVGGLCGSFCLIMGAASVFLAWTNFDGSFKFPKETAAGFAIFWGSFMLLGAWLIAAYVRERLTVTDHGVQMVGCIRTRMMRFDRVTAVRWSGRQRGVGYVRLVAEGQRMKIEFGQFGWQDDWLLIQRIRNRMLESIQENWEEFER